jgi:chemotaxis signal transduction protein
VDAVIGLRSLDSTQLGALPPMLRDVAADFIEAIGTRDGDLLILLRLARIVPEDVWNTLARDEAT